MSMTNSDPDDMPNLVSQPFAYERFAQPSRTTTSKPVVDRDEIRRTIAALEATLASSWLTHCSSPHAPANAAHDAAHDAAPANAVPANPELADVELSADAEHD